MSKYPFVPLGELGEIVAGSTPDTTNKEYWGGDIAWITPADLTNHEGIFFTGELRKITEAGYKSCSTRILPAGSILFSTRAPIGHCAVTSFPLCTNQGFKSIIPNERLDPVYGFFALKFFTPQIEALGRGATFTEVNKETFENFEIPLPPLAEQKRIASLLARADRLRQLRRAANALADSLLQSVFLEMFGDPIENTNHWKMVEFSDVAKKITDGEHLTPKTLPTGLPIVMAQQVEASGVNLADCKFVSEEDFKKFTRKCKPEFGDLLLVSRGATIGRSCVVNTHEPFCLMGSVILIKPDGQKINSKFLGQIFKNSKFQEYIRETSSASAQQAIYVAHVAERKIILPPLSLQEEFARVVARVESLRGRMAESERQAQNLFESLLAQSFGG